MPELPDITVYVEALAKPAEGATRESVRVHGPALLRTVDPPLADRALSRLLEKDWPRTLEELEERHSSRPGTAL